MTKTSTSLARSSPSHERQAAAARARIGRAVIRPVIVRCTASWWTGSTSLAVIGSRPSGRPEAQRRSGIGGASAGGQQEGHVDLGPAVVALADPQRVADLGDEAQAEAEPGTVRARHEARALVEDRDDERAVAEVGRHVD